MRGLKELFINNSGENVSNMTGGAIRFSEDFIKRMERRLEFFKQADEKGIKQWIEVEVVKHDNLLSEASTRGGDITWFSDEPASQGGSGKGVSPLAYFLSSIGLCQFVHYAEHASTRKIPLKSLRMVVRGKFSIAHPRSFEEISYEVFIESDADKDTVSWLAQRAADDCYVTNTLKKACSVRGVILHNGEKLLELA